MQTRPYVPGRVLWGALTANLVRSYDDGSNGWRYREVGEAVNENFLFGYLWPAIPKSEKIVSLDDLEVRFPWDEKELPFDYLFLDAYASTALDYTSYSASEGTLHHVEYIMPYTRGADPKPVFLVGDIFVRSGFTKEENVLQKWEHALRNLQLGGERSYGWGRVEVVEITSNGKTLLETQGFQVSKHENEVVITVEKENSKALSHVLTSITKTMLRYPLEVLTGYEMGVDGRYKLVESPPIAYLPGVCLVKGTKIQIKSHGLWEVVK